MKALLVLLATLTFGLSSLRAEDAAVSFLEIGKPYLITFSNNPAADPRPIVIRKSVGNGFYEVAYFKARSKWLINLGQVVAIKPFEP